MTDADIVVKEGSTFLITAGSYSDYHIRAALVAKKDIPLTKIALKFPEKDSDGFTIWDRQSDFVAYLVKEGYAEDAGVREYHIGDYGDLEIKAGYCLEAS